MPRRRLMNVQWRFMRFAVWMCFLSGLAAVFFILSMEDIKLKDFIEKKILGIPYGFLILTTVVLIGAVFGYIFGNLIKKRLEVLVEVILKLERGDLSQRAPELGDDEIGLMAQHVNTMADRIEKQVASLQKLSAEKAEWNEALKESAIHEERQRLARELHDAVSQQLFAISMMSSAVQNTLKTKPNQAAEQIATIARMAGEAQTEMRALLLQLRPVHLEGKGLKEGIEGLLKELDGKQNALTLKWYVDEIEGLSRGVEDHLFRIVQEGLSNALRHARASTVNLRLNRVGDRIHLKIIDDGIGFDINEQKSSSYGLQTIQERVNEIGGVFEIMSIPGKGTQLEVKVPLVQSD
ncbi:MAG: sensor histidine kinase [Bacillaceae bacterium]|nr:sensor histidine kinase [Bacillaceae bacterium]